MVGLGGRTGEMPIDPHLPYLFDGDEILFSVRLFTHGWDIYTPTKNVVSLKTN